MKYGHFCRYPYFGWNRSSFAVPLISESLVTSRGDSSSRLACYVLVYNNGSKSLNFARVH